MNTFNDEIDYTADVVDATKSVETNLKAIQAAMKQLADLERSGGYIDSECAHGQADYLLCEALKLLGYEDLVSDFEELTRWYA